MTTLPTGAPLVGGRVRLDRLAEADLPALSPLLADPGLYASGYVVHRRPRDAEDALALARERFLARPGEQDGHGRGRTAYAVRLVADGALGPAGTLVGTSSLGETDVVRRSQHLGWTLYGRRWWGTAVNPEAKLLLLGHAFGDCGAERVKVQTDVRNTRSQAAIARLGAVREGVLRHEQQREDGSWRDTVVFSVLAAEWPAVRAGLLARLDGSSGSTAPRA